MDPQSLKDAFASNAIPDFENRSDCKGLAIVTGGSSGMGKAFAMRAATCGMTVVVMDIGTSTFPQLESELKAAGAPDVMTAKCDVSSWAAMNSIGEVVMARFPSLPISIICANAGYGGPPLLTGEPEAIQKQIDVLTNGVIWAFKAFQSRFLAQKEPCALVATSSIAGVFPAGGSYGVGKHGAVAVMESMNGELASMGKNHVTTHVLCPGIVSTGIGKNGETGADEPKSLQNDMAALKAMKPREQMMKAAGLAFRLILEEEGMPIEYAADTVWEAIDSGKFYMIMDHPNADYSVNADKIVAIRHQRLEAGAPPPGRQDRSDGTEAGMGQAVQKRMMKIMEELGAMEGVPVLVKSKL